MRHQEITRLWIYLHTLHRCTLQRMPTNTPNDRTPEQAFAERLRQYRDAQGLTQGDLADEVTELGIPMVQQTIQKTETGRRPIRLNKADVLARAVGVPLPNLLGAAPWLTPTEARTAAKELRPIIRSLEADLAEATAIRRELEDALVRATRTEKLFGVRLDFERSYLVLAEQLSKRKG